MPPWPVTAPGRPDGAARAGRRAALTLLLLAVVCLLLAPQAAAAGTYPAGPVAVADAVDRAEDTREAARPDAIKPPRTQSATVADPHAPPLVTAASAALPAQLLAAAEPRRAAPAVAHPPYSAPLTGRAPPAGD